MGKRSDGLVSEERHTTNFSMPRSRSRGADGVSHRRLVRVGRSRVDKGDRGLPRPHGRAHPSDAHRAINALQRRSHVVVQKSLREGFALTVSEALWKRRAVVASAVGGIPLQVIHERTGMLVRSIEGCAYQMTRLLRAPELRRRLGSAGHEHVKGHFLHPREAQDYLAVFVRLLARAHAGQVA
jgi:glycosyltransferase involved in cell wall biosynthesis